MIEGGAPPGARLRLHKSFATPTCQPSCTSPTLFVDDVLETTLEVGESGRYEWHVNPSSRPLVPGEVWTMSCQLPGEDERFTTVAIDRGERVTVDWRGEPCGEELPATGPGKSGGKRQDQGRGKGPPGTRGSDPSLSHPARRQRPPTRRTWIYPRRRWADRRS